MVADFFALGLVRGMLFPITIWAMQLWMKYEGFSNTIVGFVSIATAPIVLKIPLMSFLGRLSFNGFLGSRNNARGWLVASTFGYALAVWFAILVTPFNFPRFLLGLGCASFFASLMELVLEIIRSQRSLIEQQRATAGLGAGDRLGSILVKSGLLCVVTTFGWGQSIAMLVLLQLCIPLCTRSINKEYPAGEDSGFVDKKDKFFCALRDVKKRLGWAGLFFPLAVLISEAFVRPMVGVMLVDSKYEPLMIAIGFGSHYCGGLIGVWFFAHFLPKHPTIQRLWWAGLLNSVGNALIAILPLQRSNISLIAVLLISGVLQGNFLQLVRVTMTDLCASRHQFVQLAWWLCLWSSTAAIACTSGLLADWYGSWLKYFLFSSGLYLPFAGIAALRISAFQKGRVVDETL